jgi:arabinogalactan oligomer/maltooligosaccharide transport system substrate-binding protein
MTNDVAAGADLFGFAQDQTARLIQAGALNPLGVKAAETVKAEHDKASVTAVTSGDLLYGYPMTSDNGYFMYYDKSVISEDMIGSLEAMVAACEAAGKNFSFELENSWYIVSFFFATGCVSEWQTDADGKFISVTDNFNSDKGLIAAEGLKKIVTSPCYVNSSATSDFEAAIPSAVVVSGTWNYENAKSILGDNLGIAELPSFEVNGQSYHLASFNGCKLMGVKPQTDAKRAAVLNQLAQYLTSEKCQLERFNGNGWGPSNVAAQAADEVKAATHLTALMAQNAYSRPQGQIHGSWWDIAKVIATSIKEGGDLQEALTNYQTSMEALFQMSDDVLNAWTVIGAIGGTSWDTDLEMTEENGVWTSVEAYEIADGVEFKVRQGKSWDNNYGQEFNGANVTLEWLGVEAGTYYIVFDANTGVISVVAA